MKPEDLKIKARLALAIGEAIAGRGLAIAAALRLGKTQLYNWSNQYEDEHISPHQRVLRLHDACIKFGAPRDKADLPIHAICEAVGLTAFRIPKAEGTHKEISTELVKTVKGFGDVATASGKALEDDSISKTEARKIDTEVMELVRQLLAYRDVVNKAAGL